MITIDLPGRKIGLAWKHVRPTNVELEQHKRRIMFVTRCYIAELAEKEGEQPQIVSASNAFCSKLDTFVKERGRKVSLKKALDGFTREERGLVWKAYLNRRQSDVRKELAQ